MCSNIAIVNKSRLVYGFPSTQIDILAVQKSVKIRDKAPLIKVLCAFLIFIDAAATAARYSIPEGLTEYMTVCNSGEKPLMVLYFLTQLKFQRVLCFASSLEATHR